MTNTPRLSKSGIEYLDYQWGVFSGCHNLERGICPVENCWARSLTQRFRNLYPNGFEPTFYPDALDSPPDIKQPSRIGVGWVGDIIGYGAFCREQVYRTIRACPWHTFLFLTKNPGSLRYWEPFPDNCWIGFSACNRKMLLASCQVMREMEAQVKFVSIEPMLEDIWCLPSTLVLAGINLVIFGAQTNPKKLPRWEWVKEIVSSCDKTGVKVFLKNNLKPLLLDYADDKSLVLRYNHGESEFDGLELFLRQEIPQK